MKLICPACRAKIPSANVNVTTDLAKCDNCKEILNASLLMEEADGVSPPPAGSRIRVEEDAEAGALLILPPAGFAFRLLFPLVFSLFWLGFIAFWTWGASRAGGAFALFSIPFWCVGFCMLGGLLNNVCERQRIQFGSGQLELRKIRPFFGRRIRIPLEHVSKVVLEEEPIRDPFTMARHMRRFPLGAWAGGVTLAVITHGTCKTPVGEHLSEPESEWLVRTLRTLISRAADRRLP